MALLLSFGAMKFARVSAFRRFAKEPDSNLGLQMVMQ